MTYHMHKLARKLEQAVSEKTHHAAITATAKLFEALSGPEAAALLASQGAALPIDTLGFVVLPALRDRLRRDDALFESLVELAKKKSLSRELKHVLLDFLDDAARHVGEGPRLESFHQALRDIAAHRRERPELRGLAARLLARSRSAHTATVLDQLLAESNPRVVSGAAHTIGIWHAEGVKASASLLKKLLKWAQVHPRKTVLSPAILGTVAQAGGIRGQAAIQAALREAKDGRQLAQVLAATGVHLGGRQLADVIRRLEGTEESEGEWVVKGLFRSQPEALQRLYQAGQYREMAYVLALVPDAASALSASELKNVLAVAPSASSKRLRSLLRSFQPLAESGVGKRLKRSQQHKDMLSLPLNKGFETGFHLADALYRSLLTHYGNADHWHTALFLGFSGNAAGTGEFKGINASKGIGWSDTIAFFSAKQDFGGPAADLGARMQNLRKAFLTSFAEGHENHPFHGARSVPNLLAKQRAQIAQTAASFFGKDIWWTWVDMLDYRGWDWTGKVQDIDETRCDGLIEYSYEVNGIKVCRGEDSNKWNISKADTDYVENHNDFHNHAYNPGELCPKVQAGNDGSDSTFVVSMPQRPVITGFFAEQFSPSAVPVLLLRVTAPKSPDVFARLIVRKKGGSTFHFAQTEEPVKPMKGTPVGPWRFMKIPQSENVFAFWAGKTQGGPDFSGENGTYEFRLQVVDCGGNVSDQQMVEVSVDWP
ncbi:HEAT repeat domain-containing protein [Archangium violaceum]|uniref:hypothetical protein n=1 Tax=Archangium violaceum TaxID=83451 RepID=UPI002B28892C|nr:HEAT repeat domain-containing protein [Archangium gephyra]